MKEGLIMNLEKSYKMQEELDKHILEKHNLKMSKEELLDNTILALLVEVGELANTTRCFKHWSTKGMMDKEIVLDELADVLHFYLSIGNQIGEKYLDIGVESSWIYSTVNYALTFELLVLYSHLGELGNEYSIGGVDLEEVYQSVGDSIFKVIDVLGFSDEEVEQAYLKKHEENYRRQREGY